MNVVPSVIRTGVPVLVGVGVSFAAAKGIHISPELESQIVVLIGAAAASVYHWVVRLLEERWPHCGWLLGIARSPDYSGSAGGSYLSVTEYDEHGRIIEMKTSYRPQSGTDEDGDSRRANRLY